ncbi:hypothetical protein GCM10023093_17610 [Nemorincola caseinilytica]|uniref:Restriction endonuclease n=1 Tax=Nemorincola caseinilytica TaxID=2054315 RepID=A0ABP8NH59_9BACT
MTPNLLAKFINAQTYDVRQTHNGRWLDQKCAYDSVCFVADCILEYVRSGGQQPFQSPDIWKSEYAVKNVQAWFGKPDPLIRATLDEYNKFFRQPMKMLAAAGILNENKKGIGIQFTIAKPEILEYIALRERNTFEFLCLYIEKTLRDSGLWDSFESFFDEQSKTSLEDLKGKFSDFCIRYTPINTDVEANRIFIKVLNPLACKYHTKGTISGRISQSIITLDNIMYNQPNWRDVGKDKNVARGDYKVSLSNQQMYEYKISRAAKNLKQFNDKYNGGKSEVLDKFSIGEIATHMHHIFPKNEFQEIADYIENLIALTSGQHLQRAHPNGKTTIINKDYQYVCLIAKTESIRKNIMENHGESIIYDFGDFMHVLDVGLKTDYFSHLPQDFHKVVQGIEFNYA